MKGIKILNFYFAMAILIGCTKSTTQVSSHPESTLLFLDDCGSGAFIYDIDGASINSSQKLTAEVSAELSTKISQKADEIKNTDLSEGKADLSFNSLFDKKILKDIKREGNYSKEFYEAWNTNVTAYCRMRDLLELVDDDELLRRKILEGLYEMNARFESVSEKKN